MTNTGPNKGMPMDQVWISGAAAIGRYLGMTRHGAVQQLVSERGLPAKKLFGLWRALPEDLDEWMKRQLRGRED